MATPDAPTAAQSLLALYGALDRAASTHNPEIEAIVERYLPGTTGENAGWYDELLDFQARLLPEFAEPVRVPNLLEALNALQAPGETGSASATAVGSGPASEPEQPLLSTVQQSRMAYAIGALCHLPDWYQPDDLTVRFANLDEPFWRALKLAGGPDDAGLLDLQRLNFHERAAFTGVMQTAWRSGLINPAVADVPMCQPKMMTAHGRPCIVLTTEFTSQDVSLDQLKDVIDPLNWGKCLSSFFCEMEWHQEREDGWSRVLEHVSTTCWNAQTHLQTPLKYWKSQGQDEQSQQPTACINYALDDNPCHDAKGDGVFVVDEGFIRMTSTSTRQNSADSGVHVRTRKVASIRNLSLTPLGIFACSQGYGDQGLVMLVDGVKKRDHDQSVDWTSWAASVPPSTGGSTRAQFTGGASEPAREISTEPGQPAQQPPTGPDTSRRAVELAVKMLNECIDDMAVKSAAIAEKWATGVAPIADTMAYTTDLAVRLATDPWRYLERLRYPAQEGDKQ